MVFRTVGDAHPIAVQAPLGLMMRVIGPLIRVVGGPAPDAPFVR